MKKLSLIVLFLTIGIFVFNIEYRVFSNEKEPTQIKKQLIKDLSIEKKPHIKARIIANLGNLKAKEVVPEIINALKDDEWIIKITACRALGKIGDKRATYPLIKKLQDKEENWSIKLAAAESLAKISDPSAFEPLIEILRYECIIDRKKLSPPIPKSVGSDDEVLERRYVCAIVDLCLADTKKYVPHLMKYLKKEKVNSKLKFYFAEILARLGEKEVVPILIEYLKKSENGLIREGCAILLGDLQDKRAIEPLKQALKDDYILTSTGDVHKVYGYVVRLAAYSSLRKLGVKVKKKGNEYEVVE